MSGKTYFIYITTNPGKTVLYIGVTNDLKRRLQEHRMAQLDERSSFTGGYLCYNLIYYEVYEDVNMAIARETKLKKWSRAKKEALIATRNPKWRFLDNEI